MYKTDFLHLYIYAFIFGIVAAALYDVIWVVRVSFFRNRFVWLTDILATSWAGIFISVLQYNFNSGKFRFLPFLIFAFGVLFVRLTFSRILRKIFDRIVELIAKFLLKFKIKNYSRALQMGILHDASKGFGLLKRKRYR